jgi:hypothetical protein
LFSALRIFAVAERAGTAFRLRMAAESAACAGNAPPTKPRRKFDMKYLAAALATLFVVAANAPAANAETATCAGGVYNPACIAGAYDVVVVRPRAVVVRRPRCVWVRGRCV